MAIDPVTAAFAAKTAKEFFGKLFGALPRGDFQKFKRTIYPHMVQHADSTGNAVYAFWFGDVIRVGPGGAWGSIGVTGSIAGAEEMFKVQAEKEGTIWVIRCGSGVDWNSSASISSGCTFVRMTGSLMGRVTRTVIDLLPGGDTEVPVPTIDRGPGTDTVDSPFGPIPDVSLQAGFFGGSTGIFAIVGIIGLLIILPRLGDSG